MSKWITLHLTSPHMTDARVHRAGGSEHEVTYTQHLLKSNKVGLTHSDPGKIDGEFGLHSANATHQAKWFIGLPKRKVNKWFNNDLALFLNGGKNLSAVMKWRRKVRLARWKKAHANPKRVKAAKLALTQIGTKESPWGSNRVKYSIWYGIIGPWCAMFGTWAGVSVGQRSFKRGVHYSYCPYVIADAVAGRNGLSVTHDPQEGDVVIYHWPGGNPMGDHFGRFLSWHVHGYSFYSIEGNTGAASASNGGEVLKELRYVANVVHFVRVAE